MSSLWGAQDQKQRADPEDTRELDRWLIVAQTQVIGVKYLDENFDVTWGSANWFVARPFSNPHDPFLIKVVSEVNSVVGQIYYEVLTVYPTNQILPPKLLELQQYALKNRRVRDTFKTHVHPEPLEALDISPWETDCYIPEVKPQEKRLHFRDLWEAKFCSNSELST